MAPEGTYRKSNAIHVHDIETIYKRYPKDQTSTELIHYF